MGWEAHVGKEKVSPPLVCTDAVIDAYVTGIAERNPRHLAGADRTAPPLFVAASIIPGTGSLLMDVGLGPKIARIVHGGIEISFGEPVRANDTLTCTSNFAGVEEKSSGELIDFGFRVDNGDGATVCSGLTRYFVRGAKKGSGGGGEDEALRVDHEVREVVPEGQSLLYAEGSFDRFPIHTNPQFARSVGLPDVILHGMCTLAFATRAVVDTVLGGDSARLAKIGVRFSKMVFHGDDLRTRIQIDEVGGNGVRFETANQDGKLVLREGTAALR